MAFRDKLRTNTQSLLPPGETIEEIVPARAGISPWLSNGIGFLAGRVKFRIIARTNQSLLILDGGMSGIKPKTILKRLPHDTPIGPLKGIWARTIIDGEKYWISWKFHKDLTSSSPPPTRPLTSM